MSTPARPRCANPIDVAALMDYWRAALDTSQEEAVELHLFDCDACGDRLRQMIALAGALRDLARSGTLRVVVGSDFPEHAVGEGRQVREYGARPGENVQCTVSADDDFLVARLVADLSDAERVDLSVALAGVEIGRMQDVPMNAETGNVVYQESIDFAKTAPSNSMQMRLLAIDAAGGERLLGEYTFHHTRTIPGPPGWNL